MKSLALIIVGVLILRTFEPTFDIIGFWPVLGVLAANIFGLGLIGVGITGTA